MIEPYAENQLLQLIVVAELGFTSALVGLIWLIQMVHYPLFSAVGSDAFVRYEEQHCNRISLVVIPLMVGEVLLAAAHLVLSGVSWQSTAGACLLAIIWLSTLLVQMPLHRQLAAGYDSNAHRALVRSNWIRTVSWSCRAILVAFVLGAGGSW